jgi:hypothetical protein
MENQQNPASDCQNRFESGADGLRWWLCVAILGETCARCTQICHVLSDRWLDGVSQTSNVCEQQQPIVLFLLLTHLLNLCRYDLFAYLSGWFNLLKLLEWFEELTRPLREEWVDLTGSSWSLLTTILTSAMNGLTESVEGNLSKLVVLFVGLAFTFTV